jgi:hypothetical protein
MLLVLWLPVGVVAFFHARCHTRLRSFKVAYLFRLRALVLWLAVTTLLASVFLGGFMAVIIYQDYMYHISVNYNLVVCYLF